MATDSKYSMFVLYMLMASVHNDINAHCSLLKMAASQLVTGQLVTRSTRHTVNSSQRGGQLVTSKHQSHTAAAV